MGRNPKHCNCIPFHSNKNLKFKALYGECQACAGGEKRSVSDNNKPVRPVSEDTSNTKFQDDMLKHAKVIAP